jgi:hypothetical protein
MNNGVNSRDEAMGGLGGDIGARDATDGEIASGFNNTSLGEADTEHMLQVPRGVQEFTVRGGEEWAGFFSFLFHISRRC